MGKYEVHTKLRAIWKYIDFMELWMQSMWLKATKTKNKNKKSPQKTKNHVFNF